MTVTVQTPIKTYTAAAAATVFPYDFKIFAGADLVVKVDGVTKTLSTHYTVSGAGVATGGNVTFLTPMTGGEAVVILRDLPNKRDTNYQEGGDLLGATHNNDHDYPIMLIQEVEERVGRAPKVPAGSVLAGDDLVFPAPGAGEFIRWNGAGTALETAPAIQDLGNFTQSGEGAVTRTAIAKLGENLSIGDFANSFQVAHDSLSDDDDNLGGRIMITRGSYAPATTWAIDKRVWVLGEHAGDQIESAATLITFGADTTGVRVYSSVDAPNAAGADGTRLSALNIRASAKNASGHGIHATTKVKVEDSIIRTFKQHGIYIHGQTGVGATGIADFWYVGNTRIIDNDGDGLKVEGNDANVGLAVQAEAVANDGWGFNDQSQFGCTYLACQAAGNASGSYKSREGAYSVYLGCYVEGSTGSNTEFGSTAMIYGGVLGSTPSAAPEACMDSPYRGRSWNVASGNSYEWNKQAVVKMRLNGADTLVIGDSTFDPVTQRVAGAWFLNDGGLSLRTIASNLNFGLSANAGNLLRFFSDDGAAPVLAGYISVSGNTAAYNSVSDYRLKENFESFVGALDLVDQLNPGTFTWRGDGQPGMGFIAHELQAHVPLAVTGEKDATEEAPIYDEEGAVVDHETKPSYQSVDASKLVPILVAAIQELRAEFAAYKAAHP